MDTDGHATWPASLDPVRSTVSAEALMDPEGHREFLYENHGERFSLSGEWTNAWPIQ